MHDLNPHPNLLTAARETLLEVNPPALEVFKETGLTPSWQQAFRTGRLKDPGYTRVCALLGWLARSHGDSLDKQFKKLQ